MMFPIEFTAIFVSRLVSNGSRRTRTPSAPWQPRAYAAAVFAKIRDLAPYAAIELILPGGSLLALLLWLYRRYKKETAPRLTQRAMGCRTRRPARTAAPAQSRERLTDGPRMNGTRPCWATPLSGR
jgi:hypothetical protein